MKPKINSLLARAMAALCCLAPAALWAQSNPAPEGGEAQAAAAFRKLADAAYAAKDIEAGNRHLRDLLESCPGRWDLARPALETILRMSKDGPDDWREYAALRLIAAGRAEQILPTDPCLREAWETLIFVRQRQGRLLEANAACEAMGETFGRETWWQFLKARLCYQADAYEAGARFSGLLAAVSGDDANTLAPSAWYAMQPYLEDRGGVLQTIVAAYESGRLLPSAPPREMIFKNCSTEWEAVRMPPPGASPQQVHSVIQESLKPMRLIPDESTATIAWLWNLIDRHLLSQTPEALLPLRRLQEDDLRDRLGAARVVQAYSGDAVELFRRYPWTDSAQRELLEYGRKELSRGHTGVALRSFRDVLSHASSHARRSEAQVCLWLALAQQGGREEFAAAFRGIDPEKGYPWMGGTEPVQAIRRRLEEGLAAIPMSPREPRLRDIGRRAIRVPAEDLPPASGPPRHRTGASRSSISGAAPMSSPPLPKVGVQFHGDDFLVSSPNIMAWYRAADPGVPVWQRTVRFASPEFGQLPGISCPAVAGDRLFLRWGHDEYPADVAAVDVQTGGQIWSTAQDDSWRSQGVGFSNRRTWPVNDPVLADGRLYLLAVRNAEGGTGEMHLQCLAPDTGTAIWNSLIADEPFRGAEGWDLGHRGRHPALYGNAVTPHDGAVYCAANVGIVARCDARDGYLEWAHKYPRTKYSRRETVAREFGERGDSFAWGAQPIVAGRRAIFLPRDYDGVFALDADTGRLLWQNAFIQPAGAIGVFAGTLLVYDRKTIAALDLETGTARWFRRFEEGIIGGGQLIGSSLYVGTPRDLCRLHAGSGVVIERTAWGEEGRLVRDFAIHEGVLYLVSDEPAPADDRRPASAGAGRRQLPAGGASVKLYRRLESVTADGSRHEWNPGEYAELPLDDTDKERGSLWLAQDGRNLHLAIAYKDARVTPLCGDGGYSDGDWSVIDVRGGSFRSGWEDRPRCRRPHRTQARPRRES